MPYAKLTVVKGRGADLKWIQAYLCHDRLIHASPEGIIMEWFWIIIASLGAGIGTGLAGLSAATVMVPILIVLCPSFGGERGAYQATAIALP